MALDLRQQRLPMAIVSLTMLSSSGLLASGVTRMAAGKYLPLDASTPSDSSTKSAAVVATSTHKDPQAILHRNIFDSATGPLDALPEAPKMDNDTSAEPAEEAPLAIADDPTHPPPKCDGPIRLVGSFYMPRDATKSFAAITNTAGKVFLYRENQHVDDKVVSAIGSSHVFLRQQSGVLCRIGMFDPPEDPNAPATPAAAVAEAPAAPSEGDGALSGAELDQGIQKVSDTQYNVSRSLLNKVLENQAALMSSARVIPQEENGRTVGVKLYGIRHTALLGRLGLQNGDVLRTINGYNIAAPDSALEAYTRLRTADQLTVSIMRRGTPTNINFSIH